MKVLIVGHLGVVGGAMFRVMQSAGIQVRGMDKRDQESVAALWADPGSFDVVFVCVPTPYDPMREDLDYQDIKDAYHTLCATGVAEPRWRGVPRAEVKGPVICLRSTVTPSCFTWDVVCDIYHPEFLSGGTADADFARSSVLVIGAEEDEPGVAQRIGAVLEVYKMIREKGVDPATPEPEVIRVSREEAALLKLAHNAWGAMNIVFANEMRKAAWTAVGADTWNDGMRRRLCDLLRGLDRSFETYSLSPGPDGRPGFGGACFPKDLSALCGWARDHGASLEMLEAVHFANRLFRP